MDIKNFIARDSIIEQTTIMNGRLLANLDIIKELQRIIDKKWKESKDIEKEQEKLFEVLHKMESDDEK